MGASLKFTENLQFYDDIDHDECFNEEDDESWQEYLDYMEIQELLKQQGPVTLH